MSIFDGLSAFPITPADADGRVDTGAVGRLTERLLGSGVNAICVLGSTGTFAYLTPAERKRVAEAAIEAAAGRLPLIIGVGALRTDTACELARHAAQAGADGLLMPPISYTPLTQDEAFTHYQTVSNATDLPLTIYNNPGTTHFKFRDDLIARIAELANVAAVKMPLPHEGMIADELARLRPQLPEGFTVGYSGDWGCCDALISGADAWFSAIAGTLPDPAVAITEAVRAGDTAKALQVNDALTPMWELFTTYGSLRVIYSIGALQGLPVGSLPAPIHPMPDADLPKLEAVLDALSNLN